MDYKDLTLENINDVPGDELVDCLFESMEHMKNIDFVKISYNELSKKMEAPNFDLLKSKIKIEDEGVWKVSVPFVDEKERDYYKKIIKFGLEKYFLLPDTGGFVKCDAKLIEKPLGLVEIHYWGDFITRMYKNHSFDDPKRIYNKRDYFYYDYEENKYIQVHSENLEKAKYDIQKGRGFQPKSKEDELINMYINKENLLKVVKGRLKEISEESQFHQKFMNFIYDKYDKNPDEGRLLSPANILNYLERTGWYLYDHFERWLKIKLLISSIDRKEYTKLIQETQRLNEVKENITYLILQLKNHLSGDKYDRENYNLDNENMMLEAIEIRKKIKSLLKEFTDFKTPKPPGKIPTKGLEKQGFIYDENEHKLYPNAAEIERRRLKTLEHYSDEEYDAYQNEVLKRLKEV